VDRRNWVISQMADNNYITDEQAAAAKAEPLVTQTRALGSQAADVDYYCRGSAPAGDRALSRHRPV